MTKSFKVTLLETALRALIPRQLWRKRRPPPRQPRNILVARTDHIGDVYLSLPALKQLRDHYPEARLSVIAASWAAPILERCGPQDVLIVCDPPWWSHKRQSRFGTSGSGLWRALWATLRRLRAERFDLYIDLRGDVRDILAFGVFGGAKYIFARDRNGGAALADLSLAVPEDGWHESRQNLHLIEALGVTASTHEFPLPYADTERDEISQRLSNIPAARHTVVIHPGAKHVNRWPAAAFRSVISGLWADPGDIRIILTGTASEARLCDDIAAKATFCHNWAGQLTLPQTAALFAQVDVLLMADTGPMHFLNALKTPAVLLFGPTPEVRFAPCREGIAVISAGFCCQTSLHEHCLRAPADAPSACMASIDPVRVIDQLRRQCAIGFSYSKFSNH